ncbi:MAG: hypothetical protein R8K49_00390 [Mariprofundaceae bacterium]
MKNRIFLYLGILLWLSSCQGNSHSVDKDLQQAKLAKIHYQIGLDALHKNRLPKAFEELMLSNKQLPGQIEVLDALAYAWRIRGDLEKSEAFYKQALATDSSPSTHTNYGSLLVALKRYQEAEVQLHLALNDPRYRKQFISLINLGDAQLGLKKFDEAITSYHNANLINPDQTLPQIKQAEVYRQLKRYNYAQAIYKSILQKQPTHRQALEGLLQLLKKSSDLTTARQYLTAYIERVQDPLARAWASDKLTALGRP